MRCQYVNMPIPICYITLESVNFIYIFDLIKINDSTKVSQPVQFSYFNKRYKREDVKNNLKL